MRKRGKREHTFVMTAIEAKEFPKFIPMTVCEDGISIGSCALPFGTCPLRDILRLLWGVMVCGCDVGCRFQRRMPRCTRSNQDNLISEDFLHRYRDCNRLRLFRQRVNVSSCQRINSESISVYLPLINVSKVAYS
jgi:hypothetical protein